MKLTDSEVKKLPVPDSGNRLTYDSTVKGFAARITHTGARAYVLNYHFAGVERRVTIGSSDVWTAAQARERAREMKKLIDQGKDPLKAKDEERAKQTLPTVADLAARFLAEHVVRNRPSTRAEYRRMIEQTIVPELGALRVVDVDDEHIERLHAKLAAKPYAANRVHSVLSKMFALAVKWKMRAANPCAHVDRYPEAQRKRYLSAVELVRLEGALAAHSDQQSANVIRLLLLTGARRGEVLSAEWVHFDMARGVWNKPATSTKQKRDHHIPLSDAARKLLESLPRTNSFYVFPSKRNGGHRIHVSKDWQAIRKAAGIADVRIHDLRHSYASVLASAGFSLPTIGALLGHSRAQTTARYAHLQQDSLRTATERAGEILTGYKK